MWIDIEPGCELPEKHRKVPVMVEVRPKFYYEFIAVYKPKSQMWISQNYGEVHPVAWYKVPPYQPKKQEQP